MKTANEIKKGLNVCGTLDGDCDNCAYAGFKVFCTDRLRQDALALIRQLEAELAAVKRERDAAVADLFSSVIKCDVCKHGRLYGNDCIGLFGDGGCSFEWRGVCPDAEVQEDAETR